MVGESAAISFLGTFERIEFPRNSRRFDFLQNRCKVSNMMAEEHDEPAPEEPDENGQEEEASKEDLTPEEQMAKFEEAMKNEDWGHQPC